MDFLAGPAPVLGCALRPGLVLLGAGGEPRWADGLALSLLGCRDVAELTARWTAIGPHLAAAAPDPAATAASPVETVELAPDLAGGRRVQVSRVWAANVDGNGHRPAALLLHDAELTAACESDLRAASQMRSLAQITPAVAHDLRAPINAMVLNLEVLKETLTAGGATPPPPAAAPLRPAHPAHPPAGGRDPRERQLRYVSVLREELSRLHQSLELFLAHVSPRGERIETLDLCGPAQDLAALLRPSARKQQARVELLLPDAAVPVHVQRHLLRLALLHVGLAALAGVPRDGALEIRLERREAPPRARLRIAATPAPPREAPPAPTPPPQEGPPPASAVFSAPLEPSFSGAGTEARLAVARAIVESFGGTSRCGLAAGAGGEIGDPAGAGDVAIYEIEFAVTTSN